MVFQNEFFEITYVLIKFLYMEVRISLVESLHTSMTVVAFMIDVIETGFISEGLICLCESCMYHYLKTGLRAGLA